MTEHKWVTCFIRHFKKGGNGCWNWRGSMLKTGYGVVQYSENKKHKCIRAHRASWILKNGEIPDGLWVLHKCDNRKCVRPDHLFLGTRMDNINDMISKWRHPHGERHHNRRITDSKALKIRTLYSSGKYSQQQIADKFNIHIMTVNDVIKRRTWVHL